MKWTKRRPRSWTVMILLSILLLTIGSISSYRLLLVHDLSLASHDTMENVIKQQQFTFASKLTEQENALMVYADLFASADTDDETILKNLVIMSENTGFNMVSYTRPNGDTLENTGVRLNVADRDYFKRALQGETVISNPVASKVTQREIVTMATPVKRNGEIDGVLVGIYDTNELSALLMPAFDGKGYTLVTTSDGTIILRTTTLNPPDRNKNIFAAFETVKFDKGYSIDTLRQSMQNHTGGSLLYELNGEKHNMHYMPLGINDWYIYSAAPREVITAQTTNIMQKTTLLASMLSLLFLVVLFFFLVEQKKHVSELSDIAFRDTLTGKANRKKFKLKASELITAQKHLYAFVVIDIDKFKVLNDTLGYEQGNQTLLCIAEAVEKSIGSDEFFGRCDSDEYYLLLKYIDDASLEMRVKSIIAESKELFRAHVNRNYNLVMCAGVYVICDTTENVNMFADRAKHAQQQIKGSPSSGVAFYNEEIRNTLLREKHIENMMHAALANSDFALYLQPKYHLQSEVICGAEALVRWPTADGGMMYPDEFIPVFEKSGFVIDLDFYMLENACKNIRGWIDAGLVPVPVSVNFSRLHLRKDDFVEELERIVRRYDISPNLIEIELTESTVVDNENVLIDVLARLHKYGFSLSIDDFGSGYSSLGLLKNLPVDIIKLDRTFFAQYRDLARAKTVISSMISMAKNLGIHTVAEGVETRENIELLTDLGCDVVQGYYYARPMPCETFSPLLANSICEEVVPNTAVRF